MTLNAQFWKQATVSRDGWKQIAESEHEMRFGDADLVSREAVIRMLGQESD